MKTIESLEEEIVALPIELQAELVERLEQRRFEDSEKEALAREKLWDQDPSLGTSLQELKESIERG